GDLSGPLRELRGVTSEGREHIPGPKHEHARVPVKTARSQVLLRLLETRLLDEAPHRKDARRPRLAPLDVAKTRLRSGRHDTDRRDGPRSCGLDGALDGRSKRRFIGDV